MPKTPTKSFLVIDLDLDLAIFVKPQPYQTFVINTLTLQKSIYQIFAFYLTDNMPKS